MSFLDQFESLYPSPNIPLFRKDPMNTTNHFLSRQSWNVRHPQDLARPFILPAAALLTLSRALLASAEFTLRPILVSLVSIIPAISCGRFYRPIILLRLCGHPDFQPLQSVST